jgi:hypothetical protein
VAGINGLAPHRDGRQKHCSMVESNKIVSGSGRVDGVGIASWWECGGMSREDGREKLRFQAKPGDGEMGTGKEDSTLAFNCDSVGILGYGSAAKIT